MVVFIEVQDANTQQELAEKVKKHGGKVSQFNNKNTTHIIWHNGSSKTLLKAKQTKRASAQGAPHQQVVVAPEWIDQSIAEKKMAVEQDFAVKLEIE